MKPVVHCVDLWKIYHTGAVEVPALRGVNLSIAEGEFVAIMGPSGCGKSTMLHILGGLASPSSGQVLVDGNDLSEMSEGQRTLLRRSKIGFVFQRFNLLPTISARANIALAQSIHGDGFDPHRLEVLVEMLGLKERLHHKPNELSGGEQQRVAVARALVTNPKLLLADEPTGNLDSQNSDTVLDMLKHLNQEFGQTIVMITHNPEAARYADRVLQMRDGQIESSGDGRAEGEAATASQFE